MVNESISSQVELFSELTAEETIKVTTHLKTIKLARGQELFRIKDVGDELFIILTGKIRISRQVGETELVFTMLGPGAFFGEMAVVDELARSATATAEEDCELQRLSRQDLEEFTKIDPVIAYKLSYSIARVLSRRIRRSNEAMETYIRINRALVDNPGFRDLYKGVFG